MISWKKSSEQNRLKLLYSLLSINENHIYYLNAHTSPTVLHNHTLTTCIFKVFKGSYKNNDVKYTDIIHILYYPVLLFSTMITLSYCILWKVSAYIPSNFKLQILVSLRQSKFNLLSCKWVLWVLHKKMLFFLKQRRHFIIHHTRS